MSNHGEEIIEKINNNDEIAFINFLLAISKNKIEREKLDLDRIEKTLLLKKDFPFEAKAYYCNVFERKKFMKILESDIKSNPDKYDCHALLYAASKSGTESKHILLKKSFEKYNEKNHDRYKFELASYDLLVSFFNLLMRDFELQEKAAEVFSNNNSLIRLICISNQTNLEKKVSKLVTLWTSGYLNEDDKNYIMDQLDFFASNLEENSEQLNSLLEIISVLKNTEHKLTLKIS